MPDFIAFLRAVNIRPRWTPMERVRSSLTVAGFTDVQTHIQSGNVRVSTPRRSAARVGAEIETTLGTEFGFEVPAIVRTPRELTDLYAYQAGLGSPLSAQARAYVAFCRRPPEQSAIEELHAWPTTGEVARVHGNHVLVWLEVPAHKAKLTTARLERIIGDAATVRDIKVVRTLTEKWGV